MTELMTREETGIEREKPLIQQIVEKVDEAFTLVGARFTNTGVEFDEEADFDDLVKVAKAALTMETVATNFSFWVVGDTYRAIAAQHAEKESQLEAIFGKSNYSTLYQKGWVCEKIAPKYRRMVSAYGAWRVLAGEAEDEELLAEMVKRMDEEGGFTRAGIVEAIKSYKATQERFKNKEPKKKAQPQFSPLFTEEEMKQTEGSKKLVDAQITSGKGEPIEVPKQEKVDEWIDEGDDRTIVLSEAGYQKLMKVWEASKGTKEEMGDVDSLAEFFMERGMKMVGWAREAIKEE